MQTDRAQMLAAFDEQMRRRPLEPAARVECDELVTRVVSEDGGWSGVTWSGLDAANADAVIAAQIARFAGHADWEWKHYSYDEPADLPERLRAAGFAPGPAETVLVAEIAGLELAATPPSGVSLRPVADEAGVAAFVSVHEQVFGGNSAQIAAALAADLQRPTHTIEAFVAMAGDVAVATGRIELVPGSDFASLWGGGTLPEWRGRGLFRSLVAHRAAVAAARGFRYLQVDASADSRPILERLGFVPLATTTPFTYEG